MPGSSSTRKAGRGKEEDGGLGVLYAVTMGAASAAFAAGSYLLGRSHGAQLSSPCPLPKTIGNSPSPRPQLPPVRRFTDDEEADSDSSASASKQCSICFIDFDFISNRGEQIHTTPCGHVFCHYCIYNSLKQSERCPICRHPVSPDETVRIHL